MQPPYQNAVLTKKFISGEENKGSNLVDQIRYHINRTIQQFSNKEGTDVKKLEKGAEKLIEDIQNSERMTWTSLEFMSGVAFQNASQELFGNLAITDIPTRATDRDAAVEEAEQAGDRVHHAIARAHGQHYDFFEGIIRNAFMDTVDFQRKAPSPGNLGGND